MSTQKETGVYVFTNPYVRQLNGDLMPKVGCGIIKDRLKSANSETYGPPAWKIEFAKYVDDDYCIEQKLFSLIETIDPKQREFGKRREFFTTSLPILKKMFDLLPGEWYSESTEQEKQEDSEDSDQQEETKTKIQKNMRDHIPDGMEIKSRVNNDEWIGVYNYEKNVIVYNDKDYPSPSNFHNMHALEQNMISPSGASRSGWGECRGKVGDKWTLLKHITPT